MQRVELDLEHEFSAVIKDDLLNLNCLAVSISTPPPAYGELFNHYIHT